MTAEHRSARPLAPTLTVEVTEEQWADINRSTLPAARFCYGLAPEGAETLMFVGPVFVVRSHPSLPDHLRGVRFNAEREHGE